MGKSKLPAFFVSYGTESLLLDRELLKVKNTSKKQGRLVVHVPPVVSEVVSACSQISLWQEQSSKTVIVDDAQKLKDDGSLKAYIEDHDGGNQTILVAIVRHKDLPAVWKLAAAKGMSSKCMQLKDWENNNQVVRWIDAEATRLRIKLDKGIADSMYRVVGNDLYRLSNELRKFQFLVGVDGKVMQEHLALVLTRVFPAAPYQVSEAAFQKDSRKATRVLGHLYQQEGPGAHVQVLGSLMKRAETLLVARHMLDKGSKHEDIAARLDMNPWRCKNAILPQAKLHTVNALIGHMQRLCELDSDVKGASVSKRTLVELAVLSIAGLGAC